MKSLIISSTYFPPQVGGISHYMGAIASTLGPDCVCCLTAAPETDAGSDLPFKLRVYRRPMAFGSVRHLHALAWGVTIAEIMMRERPRIVQLATADDGYLGLWLQRWLKLPFVVYAHGNEVLGAMRAAYEKPRLALRRANRVLANSRFTANLLHMAGVKADRIEIVNLGCDIEHFRPLPAKTQLRQNLLRGRSPTRVILTVGGLVQRKGHDMIIRALPRLIETIPDVTYLIVGDGVYRAQLEAMTEDMRLRDHVVFAGRVPDRDMPDIYALCDVFAMPSRERLDECDVEGFGLVFLEANACAKPVVGGRSGGIADAVEDGVTGYLVDPNRPEDIAAAISRLLTDNNLAIQMGLQGRARVVSNFSWQKIGNRVQEILEAVLREQ